MKAILDAGPLIASWNADDHNHTWAENLFKEYQGPFFTTECVLAEVAHMTGQDALVVEGVGTGRFIVSGSLLEDAAAIERMLANYSQCDLGDASIVAVSERKKTVPVLTTDRRHFSTYRRADKSAVPFVAP